MLQALVLAAQALVILHRPEDLGAKQAVALGLEGAVVDRFRLLYLAVGPGTDLLRRCKPGFDCVELFFLGDLFEQIEQCFHASLLPNIPWRLGLSINRNGRVNSVPDRYRSPASGFPSPAR